jgi:hypothetical protein
MKQSGKVSLEMLLEELDEVVSEETTKAIKNLIKNKKRLSAKKKSKIKF